MLAAEPADLTRVRIALPVALVVVCALGCRTTRTERFAPPSHVAVEQGVPARTWNVLVAGENVGRVVEFQAAQPPAAPMFIVQNAWSQDLGLIDEHGRAWRFRPHQREAEWVGTGTVADGAAWILGAPECALAEVPLERAREAAASR